MGAEDAIQPASCALATVAFVFCIVGSAVQPIWGETATVTRPDPSSLIGMKISTSRARVSAGATLGVIAEITNISGETVYLREDHLSLKVPPELEGPQAGSQAWWAYFPTFQHPNSDIKLALKPGDSYTAIWFRPAWEGDPPKSFLHYVFRIIGTELYFLFFVPGDYTLTVVGLYWTDPTFPAGQYRAITQSLTLPVAAPQSVILVGAAVGGIIAYFILPQARRRWIASRSRSATIPRPLRANARRWWQEVVGMAGAGVLSMIVTILLARISETQFLIRVSVSDLWGAITIGFVANYVGAGLLATLIPHRTDGPKEIKRAEAKAAPDGPRSDTGSQRDV